MRIGKLFIGWRAIPRWEALEFDLSAHQSWRGFFVEWGDDDESAGILLFVKATA